MNAGKTLFSQLMDCLPWSTFARIVTRYHGEHSVQTFPCTEQYRAMAFAQLTYRESLRDIEACLSAQPAKLWPMCSEPHNIGGSDRWPYTRSLRARETHGLERQTRAPRSIFRLVTTTIYVIPLPSRESATWPAGYTASAGSGFISRSLGCDERHHCGAALFFTPKRSRCRICPVSSSACAIPASPRRC